VKVAAAAWLLLILSWAGSAAAQRFDSEAMESFAARLFDRMDLNQDGTLSEDEHVQTRGGGFFVDYALLDLDGDGQVTKPEYLLAVRKYHPAPRGKPI
jgi:hypothetical protein